MPQPASSPASSKEREGHREGACTEEHGRVAARTGIKTPGYLEVIGHSCDADVFRARHLSMTLRQ